MGIRIYSLLTKHVEWNFFLHLEQLCRGISRFELCTTEKQMLHSSTPSNRLSKLLFQRSRPSQMELCCSMDTVTRLPTIQTRQHQQYLTHTLKSHFFWDMMFCQWAIGSWLFKTTWQSHYDNTMLSQNFRNQLPNHTESHLKKTGTSTTPLWKPKTSHHTLDVSAQWLLLILKLLNFSMTTTLYEPKDDTVNILVTECLLLAFFWFLVLFLLPGNMAKITFFWLAFKYFFF